MPAIDLRIAASRRNSWAFLRRSLPWLAALACGVGVGAFVTSPRVMRLFDDPLAPLRNSVGLERLGPGRFSGEIQRAKGLSPADLDRRLNEVVRSAGSSGVFSLIQSDFSTALQELQEHARQSPRSVRAWSDLAAGYLSRGSSFESSDDPLDLLAALRASLTAIEIDPDYPEGAFNYAEILTRLGLRHEAIRAWGHYLELDPASDWAALAMARRKQLAAPTHNQRWQDRGKAELLAALAKSDRTLLLELANQYRTRSRELILFELLPAWGKHVLHRDSAAAEIQRQQIVLLAEQLAEVTGDRLLADGAKSLLGSLRHQARLAAVLVKWQTDGSQKNLDDTATQLEELASPLAFWARYWAERERYGEFRSTAKQNLKQLQDDILNRHYPMVLSSVYGLLGTIEGIEDSPEFALALYRTGKALATSTEGAIGAVPFDNLEASAYERLGRIREAWQAHFSSIATSAKTGDRYRIYGPLLTSVNFLLDSGEGGIAGPFVRELLNNAERTPRADIKAESFACAGRFAASRHRWSEANAYFSAAHLEARSTNQAQRARLEAFANLARGTELAEISSEVAVGALEAALAFFTAQDYRYFLSETLLALGRSEGRIGRLDRAAQRYGEGIRALLTRRDRQVALAPRLFTLDQSQHGYDALIALQLEDDRLRSQAFSTADRAKARGLSEVLGIELESPLTTTDLQNRLPENLTLLEYVSLPDRLAIWSINRHETNLVSVPVGREELARVLAELLYTVQTGGETEAPTQRLSQFLWRPLEERIPPGSRLLVVPDGHLGDVPWALLSTTRHTPLIEEHEISMAPSAAIAVSLLSRSWQVPQEVLVISNPALDPARTPQLDRLPESAAEGVEVALLYPAKGRRLLSGAAATIAAFLTEGPRAEILHFAGHGIGQATSPADSALVLASESSEQDPLLPAWRIAETPWQRTRLVVLSSCEGVQGSVVGRQVLAGLSSAFLAGGVPTVIASPARVPEPATRALMKHFHRFLRDGQQPAQALRSAQLEILRSPFAARSGPRAWATWIVIGAP